MYLFVIAYCIYTPTGKRQDLWETCVKEAQTCLSAYMSISLMLYLLIDKWKRLSEEIVTLFDCSLLVKGYSGDFGLL